MPDRALEGLTIIEVGTRGAASYGAKMLADLGADVVKVEPPEGDQHRRWGAIVPNEGKRFQSLNRNKRGITIDLRQERGRALAHRLVPGFDIVTQNFRYHAAERMGLDYETLRALHPALIYCEITGWGRVGPMRERTATDPTATAYSAGTMLSTRSPSVSSTSSSGSNRTYPYPPSGQSR